MEGAVKARKVTAPGRPVGGSANGAVFPDGHKQVLAISDALQVVGRAGVFRRPAPAVSGTAKRTMDAHRHERFVSVSDGKEVVGCAGGFSAPGGQLIRRQGQRQKKATQPTEKPR